jgi:hypothetical protein
VKALVGEKTLATITMQLEITNIEELKGNEL